MELLESQVIDFDIDRNFVFSTDSLHDYGFMNWNPVVYDAMIVSAAVEYADRVIRRPSARWFRQINLRIPVSDVSVWEEEVLSSALHEALGFLTGDKWDITFITRPAQAPRRTQDVLLLGEPAKAVIAYSDGMDSLCVAGIVRKNLKDGLIAVRVGGSNNSSKSKSGSDKIFMGIPYKIIVPRANETSGRSRGFKFAMISGIAAYLTGAETIIIPESGQGSIGPVLVSVAHSWPDYRNHPLFASKMETIFDLLFGGAIKFSFPRIWSTKGQTLKDYVAETGEDLWRSTRSCWHGSRESSFEGKYYQCGICAACLLRRLSVHAAGFDEGDEGYICGNLKSDCLESALKRDFKITKSFLEYAIAAVLHLDSLSSLVGGDKRVVGRSARSIAHKLAMPSSEVEARMNELIINHASEWNHFLDDLGSSSFIVKWARPHR